MAKVKKKMATRREDKSALDRVCSKSSFPKDVDAKREWTRQVSIALLELRTLAIKGGANPSRFEHNVNLIAAVAADLPWSLDKQQADKPVSLADWKARAETAEKELQDVHSRLSRIRGWASTGDNWRHLLDGVEELITEYESKLFNKGGNRGKLRKVELLSETTANKQPKKPQPPIAVACENGLWKNDLDHYDWSGWVDDGPLGCNAPYAAYFVRLAEPGKHNKYVYTDRFGVDHDCRAYSRIVEVTVQTLRHKDGSNGSQDIFGMATDNATGTRYLLSYNNWGGSMGSVYPWLQQGTLDEYYVVDLKQPRFGSLPLVPVSETKVVSMLPT